MIFILKLIGAILLTMAVLSFLDYLRVRRIGK
jgi:hypothetical protein